MTRSPRRPSSTSRSAASVSPYRVTRSRTIAAPFATDQNGSEYERLSRPRAAGSTHSGRMRATVRANRREVSTSSAVITQAGCPLTPEPGQIVKCVPRAPS